MLTGRVSNPALGCGLERHVIRVIDWRSDRVDTFCGLKFMRVGDVVIEQFLQQTPITAVDGPEFCRSCMMIAEAERDR